MSEIWYRHKGYRAKHGSEIIRYKRDPHGTFCSDIGVINSKEDLIKACNLQVDEQIVDNLVSNFTPKN